MRPPGAAIGKATLGKVRHMLAELVGHPVVQGRRHEEQGVLVVGAEGLVQHEQFVPTHPAPPPALSTQPPRAWSQRRRMSDENGPTKNQ